MSFDILGYARIMKCLGLLIAFTLSVNTNAQIYRSIDKDGNAVFSDVPTDGAEEIELAEPTTVESLSVAPLPTTTNSSRNEREKSFEYGPLVIITPKDDEAIRENTGNITVTATIQPDLRSGDTVVLYLDGKEYEDNVTPTFTLSQLDRGTHTVRVSIKDENGKIIKSSKTVTFHLLRHSVQQKIGTIPTSSG